MLFLRCKCGKMEALVSEPLPMCTKCPECGSGLARNKQSHLDPAPHFLVPTEFKTELGYEIEAACKYCGKTDREIRGKASEKAKH